MGHRESIENENYIKQLPLCDEIDYKDIQTETKCSKEEKKRVKYLRESFELVNLLI